MTPERGDGVLARAHPARRGHHLGHRQRAARLPDRPVPDPGAGHERQDALDRPADQRRRPVRDRGRRLRAQARPAAPEGELSALGQPGRVPGPGGQLRAPGPTPATPAPRSSPTPWTGRPATSSTRTSRRRRRLGGIDNRGSHFYLALYWAQELAAQTDDAELAEAFAPLAETLADNEQAIVDELLAVQGSPVDIGGYYQPDPVLAEAVMRPSATFNEALATLG